MRCRQINGVPYGTTKHWAEICKPFMRQEVHIKRWTRDAALCRIGRHNAQVNFHIERKALRILYRW